jgi:hypothetical protein
MNRVQWTRLGLRLLGLLVLVYFALTLDARTAPYLGSRIIWSLSTVCLMLLANLGWLILLAMGLVATFRSAWAARLIWRGLEAGMCQSCGYDRRGCEGPCPECGAKV